MKQKNKKKKNSWKKNLGIGTATLVFILAIVCILRPGPEEELQNELNALSAEVTRALSRVSTDSMDYNMIGRREADTLEAELRRMLEELRSEQESMEDAFRHARPYFKGLSRVSEMAEKDTLISEQKIVNKYLADLPARIETARNKANELYESFAAEGLKPLNQWHDSKTASLAKPYLSKSEEDAHKLLKNYQNKINAFKRKCYNYDDDACNNIGDQANSQIALRIKPRLAKLDRLAARRRAFYNSNVEHEHTSTAPGSFDASVNKKLVVKDIAPNAATGVWNLCSKPHAAKKELEDFLSAMPGAISALHGILLDPLSKKRDYSLSNADLRFVVTADLDTTLVRHLLKDWLKGEQSPFGNGDVAFYEPTEDSLREWLVVQHVTNAQSKHPAPFDKELWIHIKTLGANERAADYLRSIDHQIDLLITGDNIPSELMDGRRYDLSLMSRLCSDAVLFVDCSKDNQSNMVLQPSQVLGTAENRKPICRIFYPEGSAERRISDSFDLRPVEGDATLPTADKEAACNVTSGALVVPWHLCNSGMRIYALALPSIEASGARQTEEQKLYGRPTNAACHPSTCSIRSHDYSLSYDINIFTLRNSETSRSFSRYCSSPAGQACVQRHNYVPLRSNNKVEPHMLTIEDLPVKPVIEKLLKAGCALGYSKEDEELFGFKLSNVAFFETNQTNPMEVQIDAADEESLTATMEYLLREDTIGSEFAVVVIGHADARGSETDNLNLSERRSISAVKKMLYNIPGGEKLKGGRTDKHSLLHYNKQQGICLATLGCGIWRPLTSKETREAAKAAETKAQANDLLRHDRRVEFFIIVPKARAIETNN